MTRIETTPLAGASGADAPPREGARAVDLDHRRLAALGLYHQGAQSAPLGGEMRAIRRALRRRLGLSPQGAPLRGPRRRRVVMVAAPQSGAGASFIAFNLALSFALEDRIGALLIEGGVRDGFWDEVSARLELPDGPGFRHWLAAAARPSRGEPSAPLAGGPPPAGEAPRAEPVHAEPVRADPFCIRARGAALRLMRAGAAEADAQSLGWPAIFADARLGERLAAAAGAGLVVIDAPSAGAGQGGAALRAALAPYADEIAMVACAGTTRPPALVAAMDELVDINDRISLILNRRPRAAAPSGPGGGDRNSMLETAENPLHTTAKGGASP